MNNSVDQKMAFSCSYNVDREGESFVAEHTLSYQFSGVLTLDDGKQKYSSSRGSLRLIPRNQLMRFNKSPQDGAHYQSLSVYFSQNFLKRFALEHSFIAKADTKMDSKPVLDLHCDSLMKQYIYSMESYIREKALDDPTLIDAKLKEGLWLLLKSNPQVAPILFNFSEPYKMDLESFMKQHYYFNVRLERFAYLTGRSLAAFKRDFGEKFGMPPGRWLTRRRLEEAHRLLSETGKSVSEIYLDLGFEDLSHFSVAFKRQYGISPARFKGDRKR